MAKKKYFEVGCLLEEVRDFFLLFGIAVSHKGDQGICIDDIFLHLYLSKLLLRAS
jgi:hypothetical protein